jgi:hypothetical protein
MNMKKLIQPTSALSERLLRLPMMTALALCLCLFASGALAQTTGSATLRGAVKDANGAVLANASVTLVNEATKFERKTNTNREGIYVFSSVPPGTYKVSVENTGFKKGEQTGLILSPSDLRALDFTLQIGAASETVTVTATADVLQTETGAKENTITSAQINNLSIISRSSIELLRILPGVVAPDQSTLEQVGFVSGSNSSNLYNVNGLRGENNNVQIDGARMMDIGANNGSIITANPDMVQEVKVQTSNYAAEHGTASILINATTKSGSSAYHGEVYDYSRDYRLGANDRSNNINLVKNTKGIFEPIQKPASQYNYPGGNIGGPIPLPRKVFGPLGGLKDKLFFFAGFEYYYQRVDEGSKLGTVPSLKMRQGDFSELAPGSVKVPAGCNAPGYVPGQAAPNNNLAPCADPTGLGKALMNLYPAPNPNTSGLANNYIYSVLRPNDRNQFTSRFDYNISDKAKLYVRLAREYEEQGFPRGLWWDSSDYELPGKLTSSNLGRSVVVNLTNIINPTMTNEVLIGASKLKLNYDFKDPDKVSFKGLGVQKSSYFPNSNPYVPLGVTPWGADGLGNFTTAYGFPILAWNDSFGLTDNLTKVYRSHTFKLGAFIEQANKRQQSNSDTNIEIAQWGQSSGTGNNFGDLFTGHPIEITQGSDRPLDNFRYYNYEFYAQDSWKVRPSFTLEYGLRVAYLPNNYERKGLGVLFDPTAYVRGQGLFINNDRTRPNGILTAASGQIPKGVLDNPPVSFMPRLNFAWDVGGKGNWVVRAGAGLFYNRVQGNYDYYSSGVLPNTYKAKFDTWSGDKGNGLTFGDLGKLDPFAGIGAVDITSRDPNSNDLPRVANMSLTIEKRLPSNNIFTVAYVGTQGRHLPQQRQVNFAPLGSMLTNGGKTFQPSTINGVSVPVDLTNPLHRLALNDSAARQFKPFSAFNSIGFYQFTGTSSYHSLQTTLSRQTGKLNYFVAYTFGKALGTTAVNETDGAAWADPIDTRGRSWGVLPYDRTHVLNLSYNYYIPDLARGAIDHPVTRAILNGWQMSGITTFQSGIPLRLRFSGAIATSDAARAWYGTDAFYINGNNTGAITPVYLKNPSAENNKKVGDKLFDINSLAIPGFGQSGPFQPPFYLRTPSRSNFDVSFFKNFKISEKKTIQFRSGFFNIFNQAYPSRYDLGNVSNSDVNLILDTMPKELADIRRITGDPNAVCPTQVPDGAGNVVNVCDPRLGTVFTPETINNFGKITTKRGHRIVELALKFTF